MPDSLLDPRAQYAVIRNTGSVVMEAVSVLLPAKSCVAFLLVCRLLLLTMTWIWSVLMCFAMHLSTDLFCFIILLIHNLLPVIQRDILCNALEEFATVDIPTFIVTGLNCPNIGWQSHSQFIGEIDSAFIDFMTGNGNVQCVMEATRGSK